MSSLATHLNPKRWLQLRIVSSIGLQRQYSFVQHRTDYWMMLIAVLGDAVGEAQSLPDGVVSSSLCRVALRQTTVGLKPDNIEVACALVP